MAAMNDCRTAIAELRSGSLAMIGVTGLKLLNPVCLMTRRHGYLSPLAVDLIELLRGTINRVSSDRALRYSA